MRRANAPQTVAVQSANDKPQVPEALRSVGREKRCRLHEGTLACRCQKKPRHLPAKLAAVYFVRCLWFMRRWTAWLNAHRPSPFKFRSGQGLFTFWVCLQLPGSPPVLSIIISSLPSLVNPLSLTSSSFDNSSLLIRHRHSLSHSSCPLAPRSPVILRPPYPRPTSDQRRPLYRRPALRPDRSRYNAQVCLYRSRNGLRRFQKYHFIPTVTRFAFHQYIRTRLFPEGPQRPRASASTGAWSLKPRLSPTNQIHIRDQSKFERYL